MLSNAQNTVMYEKARHKQLGIIVDFGNVVQESHLLKVP